MFGIRLIMRALMLASTVAAIAWQPCAVRAQTIDLSLNVFYSTATDANSGGTWELVAKASNFGLAGLEARLVNINTANNIAPSGLVNTTDKAGFNLFFDVPFSNYRGLIFGQTAISPLTTGKEQGAFYGVGQLANGSPNYPGKPVGANSEGPVINSLAGVQGIPWGVSDALGDPAWASAARLATGAFAPATTPAFAGGSSGNVFSTLGTSVSLGAVVSASVSTVVRTNFITLPDYNDNGTVDAADYVLWRRTLGQLVTAGTGADGSNNGIIDQADYNLWRANFGLMPGSGAGLAANAVPEPAATALFTLATLLSLAERRRRFRS